MYNPVSGSGPKYTSPPAKVHQVFSRGGHLDHEQNWLDFPACCLTFPDSLGLTPSHSDVLISPPTLQLCEYQEQSSVTPQTERKVQLDKVSCVYDNKKLKKESIGSSTTQGFVYKYRQKPSSQRWFFFQPLLESS